MHDLLFKELRLARLELCHNLRGSEKSRGHGTIDKGLLFLQSHSKDYPNLLFLFPQQAKGYSNIVPEDSRGSWDLEKNVYIQ